MSTSNAPDLTTAGKAILGGAAMSTGAGFWAFLGDHHHEIGSLCAIIGAACALVGLIVSLVRGRK